MNKFHVIIFAVILVIFIGLIVTTQFGAVSSNSTIIPTPPGSSVFKVITPTILAQQQQVQQGPQPGSQAYEQAAAALQGPIAASIPATIKTTKGNIHIMLFGDQAPNTVRNFILKASTNYYNNLIFHRVENWVIQGGDPKGNGTGGGQMPAEQTQRPFVVGSIGMARGSNPQINNDSQFFITKTDASWLNGQYTNFGIVTSGMNVVDNIQIGDKILGITINQ